MAILLCLWSQTRDETGLLHGNIFHHTVFQGKIIRFKKERKIGQFFFTFFFVDCLKQSRVCFIFVVEQKIPMFWNKRTWILPSPSIANHLVSMVMSRHSAVGVVRNEPCRFSCMVVYYSFIHMSLCLILLLHIYILYRTLTILISHISDYLNLLQWKNCLECRCFILVVLTVFGCIFIEQREWVSVLLYSCTVVSVWI